MSLLLMAWIDAASPAAPTAAGSNSLLPEAGSGDPNSFLSHITLTLALIVIAGIAIILAQSYLGRRRHPPEWIDELVADEELREREREERLAVRSGAETPEGNQTRQLLDRVAQLRGMGSPPGGDAQGHQPVSVADAIESARRTPERYEEPAETAAPGITKGSIEPQGDEVRTDSVA